MAASSLEETTIAIWKPLKSMESVGHPSSSIGNIIRAFDWVMKADQKTFLPPFPAGTFDIVVVNLYPFYEKVTSAGGVSFEDGIENIDIGGPTMIRAAAKVF